MVQHDYRNPGPGSVRGSGEAGSEPGRSRLRHWLSILGAGVVLLGSAAIVWWAYDRGSAGDPMATTVPLLKAEPGPTRIRPQDPGGIRVQHRDRLIYRPSEETADAPVERLLPRPERPLPQPALWPDPPQAPTGSPDRRAEAPLGAWPGSGSAGREDEPVSQLQGSVPRAPTPLPPQASTASSSGSASASVPGGPETPGAGAGAVDGGEPVFAKVLPVPRPNRFGTATAPHTQADNANGSAFVSGTASRTAPSAVASGPANRRVQLAALTDADRARQEWQRLVRQHHHLLGDLRPAFVEARVKGTLYHRVQAGPLTEKAAETLCTTLKQRQQGCIVVKTAR